MSQKRITAALLAFILISPLLWSQQEGSRTHFRGSELNGISLERGFPSTWNDFLNIAWKIRESGKGWSSPVVFGEQVWFTTANRKSRDMRAICVDLMTGEKLHDRLIFQPEKLFRIHAVNSYADDMLYISSTRGETFVYRAGPVSIFTRLNLL